MEIDPQQFFGNLMRYSKEEKTGPFECEQLVQNLNRFLIEEQVNSCIIDLYIIHIFDKSSGLIRFINSIIRNKHFNKAAVKSIEILYTLVNNFPSKLVEKNVINIYSLCISVIKSDASYDIKKRIIELLIVGLQNLNVCTESNDITSAYKQVLASLEHAVKQKHSDTVKHVELNALGLFVKEYRYLVSNFKGIQQLFVRHFDEESMKQKKSQQILSGFFTGFSYFCESYPLNSTTDKLLILKLFKYIRNKMLVPSAADRVMIGYRAAILFFANNSNLFGELIVKDNDYKFWHSKLLDWLEMGEENRKAGVTALRSLFQMVCTALSEKAEGESQQIVKYFNQWSIDTLLKVNASNHEKRLAIQCLRIFSSVSFKYLPQDEVTALFLTIMQKFEYNYVLNYDPNSEEWEYLPYYVQTIANLMQFKTFTSSEFYCLQRAVINMIKSFHQLPYLHQDLVVDGIVTTCFYLKDTPNFDAFVENVIYQGVLWTCSHEHISKADFSESNEKIITVKNFLPLWKGILRLPSNRNYDKYRMDLDDRKHIFERIVNQLVRTLMVLINKLNLSVHLKEDDVTATELEEAYQVEQTDDYAIFLNVTDFYQEILRNIAAEMFKKCICKIIKHIINKCVDFPLLSGFYKLLSYSLRIANDLRLFEDENNNQDFINSRETLTKFLEILLVKMVQYKDELLIACLQVLLECPVVVIKDMLPACVVPFITIFNVGRSFLPLAEMGLNTLEYWQENMNSSELDPLLVEVVPCLDSYLRSKSLQGQTSTNVTEKRRKTAQALKKRKVLVELEPELVKIQRKILSFIGKQSSKICEAFVHSENFNVSTIYRENLHLKVTLPYEDLHLDIHLDSFVLRVINLALYSSDRKTRVTACELLQAIVMVFLGRAKPMSQSGLSDLDDVLRAIAMPLLQLGCDIDQLVQQIFAPLFLQLIHWFASPTQTRSAHTSIIINVLMEGITHPTDSRLRDFSGKCINEFVKWTIKQVNADHLSKDPINIKILVERMRFFSSHPHPAKKLGAALIFNNIYRELREEEALVSIFWIEILHIFITSLSLIDRDLSENDIVGIQIKNSIKNLQRVFVERPETFRQSDGSRRVPNDIKGGYLKDVAIWLFQHTGSNSRACREVCMELFITICPLIESKLNLQAFVKENFSENFVRNVYEKFIENFPTPSHMAGSEDCTILYKWMQRLLCALDGYNFVIKNNLGDISFTNSAPFTAIEYFLQNIHDVDFPTALNLVKTKSWVFTSLDGQQFSHIKSLCVLSTLKLYNSVINNEVLCEKADVLLTENFWKLISNAVFNPDLLGLYDKVSQPKHLELLAIILNTFPRKIPADKLNDLVKILRDYVKENGFTSFSLNDNIPLSQRNLMRGLNFLNKTNLKDLLTIEQYTYGLVNELTQNFFSMQNKEYVKETTLEYCELILDFALTNESEFKCLVNRLHEKSMVQTMDFNKEVAVGVYFLNTFAEAVVPFILKNFGCFLSESKKYSDEKLTLEFVIFVLNCARRDKKYRIYYADISKCLSNNWSIFKSLFESKPEYKQVGIEYLGLLIPIYKLQLKEIRDWLISRLVQETDIDNKLQMFYLLVQTTFDGDVTSGSDLEVALSDLSNSVILSTSNSNDRDSHVFHRMLKNCPTIKSALIIKFFVELYSNLSIDVDMAPILIKFVNTNDELVQQNCLNLIYEVCCNESVPFEKRYRVIKNVVPPLFQSCNMSSFEKFYVEHINDILTKCEEDSVHIHILQFTLIEVLFLRIPIGSAERVECPISSASGKPKLLHFILKCTLDAFKTNPSSDNIQRVCKCHAYNALASIVSNSIKKESFYEKLFIRQEKDKDILWSGIIDMSKIYDFPISFESIPAQRKVVLNIRNELKAQQRNVEGRSRSVQYIESQRLFNSSLTEDITNFDFTNTMLRSQGLTGEEMNNSGSFQREIQLEAVNVNDHECMATICGLIQHIFDSGVSELPRADEEVDLPKWMEGIRTTLLNKDIHKNVKIFLVKVIDNMMDIFSYYAKWFLEPLLQFIVDKNAGSTTNYFVTDVLIILTKWAAKIVELSERESELASQLLSFLISNLEIKRRDIFKYNLDLIKMIVESWKSYLMVPVETIFTLISSESTSEIGIHLTSIFLVNNLKPWKENNVKTFFNVLLKRMDCTKKAIYRPCAETIGIVLYYLKDLNYVEQMDAYLKKMQDLNKYVYSLEGVAIHFPTIITSYHVSKLICSLNQIPDTQQVVHLKLIYRRVEVSMDILEETTDFKMVDWHLLLEHANLEIQIITLQIIKKCLPVFMTYKNYPDILKALSRNVNNSNALYRNCLYDIAILVYQQGKDDTGICKEIMIFGLVDQDADNREKIVKFWTEDANLPGQVVRRFPFLLSNLYKTKIEDRFLGYVDYFLLSPLKLSDKYDKEIFEHPLEDCSFEDYRLLTHWRLQHPSVVPLFAETLQSYDSFEPSGDSDMFQLRKTQTSFAFAPTQSVHDEASNKFLSLESSLGVSFNDSDPNIKNPNEMVLSQKYRSRRRFLRDKSKISMSHAHFETKKQVKKVQQRFDLAKEREKKVTIYRKYRKGDFPDIQIPLSSVLVPLQVLSLHDSEISKILFTEIFKGISSKVENDDLLNQSVSNGIKYIFEHSTYFNPNVFTTMLDVLLKNKDKFQFEPNLICYACQQSGLVSIGTLLLEEYLIYLDDQPSSSKRGPGAEENREIALWVKLAELYKELEEWDVVRSIFLEKMNCKEIFQRAIEYESVGHWRNSQDLYQELIKTDLSVERKDFYYESYFKCFANLGEWEYLPETIESVVASDNGDVWDSLWDGGWCQQKLLPWYIMAQVRDMLFTQKWSSTFAENVNKSLNVAEKTEYLQTHFSEELCVMGLLNKDFPLANLYIQSYVRNFLSEWQLVNPLFSSLRYNKVLKLRNVMEISEFLSVYTNLSDDFETSLEKLTKKWREISYELLPSILLNETRLLYRTLFINLLKEKVGGFEFDDTTEAIENLKSTKIDLDIAFIDTASESNNYFMSRKYMKKYGEPMDVKLKLALGNMLFIKSKVTNDSREVLKSCFQALGILAPIIGDTQDQFSKLKASNKVFDILTKVSSVLKTNEDYFGEYRQKLENLLKSKVDSISDVDIIVPKILRSAIENVKDESMDCETDSLRTLQHVAKGYVKLAYFIKGQENFQGDFILYVLRAMRLNSLEAKQLFPCILMQSQLGTEYSRLFIVESEKIPTWMFLGWIPQLLANVDSKNVFAISKVITRIAEAYPQAIMYPYRLSKDNYRFDDGDVEREAKYLINNLDKILLGDETVDKFLRALSYVSPPAAILKYHVGKMIKSRNDVNFSSMFEPVVNDIFAERPGSGFVTSMQGNMYKSIGKYKKDFMTILHTNSQKVREDTLKRLQNELGEMQNKEKCSVVLKDYCPWLANFSANKLNVALEIPGQYTGQKMPLPQHHVKISGFSTEVKVMSSLRKPIKVTILGMDAKEYPFLVKFGEDIRQDQRIEQLFGLMNDIFKNDTSCNNLDILTYQVIPLTSNLGIIQWINDTQPLADFFEKTSKIPNISLELDRIRNSYVKWLCRGKDVIQIYGETAVKYNRDRTISHFRSLVNKIPWDIMRTCFWSLSVDTENYIALKNNFIKSYAVLCGSQWVLGIGDRHLGNSLICVRNGKVLGIDFGHAFGTATQILPVPELVPFRLSPHIVSFMEPLRERGQFRESMIHTLRSLRENHSSLLATMQVFVQEPSLDWLEQASRFENMVVEGAPGWYPNVKVEQTRRKLQGESSVKILIEDLVAGRRVPTYTEAYVKWVAGSPEHDLRARLGGGMLTVENQVDCLIDHATDYNLLGRMYAGWTPWV